MNLALKIGLAFLALGIICFSAVYIYDWNKDYDRDCKECTTKDCQDNDPICGDFGFYYFKLMGVVALGAIILALMFVISHKDEVEEGNPESMKLTEEQKEFLAQWFHSQEGPDYDGYMGHFTLPEDVMETYRKMYPNDWD